MPEASSVRKVVRFVEVDKAPSARLWTRMRKLKIDKHVYGADQHTSRTSEVMKGFTGVCSSSSHELPPPCTSSFGLKSVLFCVTKSLPVQVRVTSSVRCMRTLTLSSIWFIAIFVVFSISLRIVTFAAASGMRTVLIQVSIRCMIVIADCRFSRYERSGSVFVFS